MENSDTWPVVERKMEELRSLTEEQWRTGEWELATLGERVLMTAENSKVGAGQLRARARALEVATESLVQVAGNEYRRLGCALQPASGKR